MKHIDMHECLIAATRYFTGRCTIAAGAFAEALAKDWPDIPEHTRQVIRRDLEGEFERDDKARAEGRDFRPLGHDCDREAWEKVREAWRSEDAQQGQAVDAG